jgi:LAGLIDADG endonuclease
MRTNGMGMHKLPLTKYFKNTLRNFTKKNNTNKIHKHQFIEWFVGFTDAEGNFTIGLDNRHKTTQFNFRFMIGLHIDDKSLLQFILNNLGCGYIHDNKDKTVSYFIITNPYHLEFILFPILDSFLLNTTKYLDYLSFKEAFLLKSSNKSNSDTKLIEKILNLKNNMNNKRSDFVLPDKHIRITPYWLLGLIEGEGSFFLRRNTFTPAFSISLTIVQQPIIEAIVVYLKNLLDPYSLIKANKTKLFNISIEKAKYNTKSKIKLSIFQLDFLVNIFIPYLESLEFKSKKQFDFNDFKLITILVYQGKHLITEVKSFILQLSNTMNNYRLSTNIEHKKNVKDVDINNNKLLLAPDYIKNILSLPPLFCVNDEGQIIKNKTGVVIRDVFVIEVIKKDNSVDIYPTLSECAIALGISRTIINSLISNGHSLPNKNISKIKKVRVYKKLMKLNN